jgi:hypothetical protein
VRGYIDDRQLDGCWLPRLPRVPIERVVQGWLDAWAGLPSRDGPVAVVTLAQEPRLIGIAMARPQPRLVTSLTPAVPGDLIARARELDAEHRAATGRAISRDTLRDQMRIGRDRAGAIVAVVRAEAAAEVESGQLRAA